MTIWTYDSNTANAVLIGADYSALSITPSNARMAPATIRAAFGRFATWHEPSGIDLAGSVHDLGDALVGPEDWAAARTGIETIAAHAWDDAQPTGALVIGLGGDHSVTWPLVTACARANPGRRIGIVQLDAHHDVRQTDPPSNGCPIRGLIESGTVRGTDVVQIGIAPFGNARELTNYCDAEGIRRVSIGDVHEHGAASAARTALDWLGDIDLLYLTIDIDALDRAHAPGTGAALPGGLTPPELFALVASIAADPRMRAVDVVEFDPDKDVANVTAYACAHALLTAMAAVAGRNASM